MKKVTDKHKKCRGKKQIKWKKSKNQYKNLEAISRRCHVHKNISRYLRYGSSHGGAATPQPSLTVFWQQKWATRQLHLQDPTHITHQKVHILPRNSSVSFLVNSHMRSSPSRTRSNSWIWVILALTSASCPSRAGSPLKLRWIHK